MNWNDYPNFTKAEFDCKETGENEMQPAFMGRLQLLRDAYKKPMRVSSGFRSENHSIEKKKKRPGAHTTGQAVDIAVDRGDAYHVLKLALWAGFTGIGVKQKGSGRFIHLDTIEQGTEGFLRPTIWSY